MVRERWSALAVQVLATVGMGVGMLPLFLLGVLTTFVQDDLALTSALVGALPTAVFLVGAAGSGLAGRLTDAFGPRAALSGLFLTATGSWLLLSLAGSALAAFFALGISGVAMALAIPATTRLLLMRFRERRVGVGLGIAHAGTQVGAVLVGSVFPTLAIAVGWRDALRLGAILPLLGLLLLPAAPRWPRNVERIQTDTTLLTTVRSSPGLLRLGAFAMFLNAGVASGIVYLPDYAHTSLGLGLVTAGLVTAVMGVSSVVGKVVWGAVMDVLPGVSALGWLVVGSALSFVLLGSAGMAGQPALWLGTALFGITATSWTVPTTRFAGVMGGADRGGRASGAVMVAGYTGGGLGPPVFGQVVALAGYFTAWGVVLVTLAIAGGLVFSLRRR